MSADMSSSGKFESDLSRWDDPFVAACRLVLAIDTPEDAAYGLIWYQYDDTSDALPLCHVWCNRDHECEVQYPSPLHLTEDEPWCYPDGMSESEMVGVLFRWIHRCWNSAGGAASRIPFYCYDYHTEEYFCLRRGRYISQREIDLDLEEAAKG